MVLTIWAAAALAAEPVPPGELARLFRSDDYPTEALDRNESGTVAVEADVNASGRVTACRITQSSGSAPLDRATCKVIAERGRFAERVGQHGGKPFTMSTSVVWETRLGGMPVIANFNRIIYTTGTPIACRTESPPWMVMQGACEKSEADAEVSIAQLAKGSPLQNREYVIEMASIPGDHLADNRLGEGAGEQLLGRQTALLTLNADGGVARCVGGEDSLAGDLASWCDSLVRNEQYEPLAADAGNPGERLLTKVQAIYLRTTTPR